MGPVDGVLVGVASGGGVPVGVVVGVGVFVGVGVGVLVGVDVGVEMYVDVGVGVGVDVDVGVGVDVGRYMISTTALSMSLALSPGRSVPSLLVGLPTAVAQLVRLVLT
jgi:hypothetical protein